MVEWLWLEAGTVLKKLILRQMTKDYEIILTQEELELLKKYVNEGEDFVNVTDEHIQQVYTSIIDKADELQEQLDAYDESTPDLLVWFYKKYNEKVVVI